MMWRIMGRLFGWHFARVQDVLAPEKVCRVRFDAAGDGYVIYGGERHYWNDVERTVRIVPLV